MQHFTTRPTGWQIAKRAWASFRDGFGQMKLLFITSMILGAAVSVAVFALPHLTNLLLASKKALPAAMIWPALGARFARAVIWTVVAAPIAVAMHRFILLDQPTRGPIFWGRRTLVFIAWLVVLQLLFAILAGLPLLMADNAPEGMLVFCARVALIMLSVYLAMLFPAVAIGAPTPSVSMRLETSMAQTVGHFWLVVWTGLLALLPLLLLSLIFGLPMAAVMKSLATAQVTAKPHLPVLVAAGLLGATNILVVAMTAAVVSWLYSWLSRLSSPSSAAVSG